MFRLAIILAAGLLTAFQAAPPSLPPRLAVLAEDARAARDFDYMALKAGGADLRALSDAVYMRSRSADGDTQRCLTEAEFILRTELTAAAVAPDDAAIAADRDAAEAAWTRWLAFGDSVMAGAPVAEPPFSHVADRVKMAQAETNPRVHELLRRAALDQLIRRGWEVGSEVWSEPPSPGARSRFESRLDGQMCETDRENTAWLKADIDAHGWYRLSEHGEAASNAAWLMAQHADRDRPFQRHVLTLLEPLAGEGEIKRSNFAYLYDRIAVGGNRPQRYGTQGRCAARNVWEPFPLENPDGVEALRAEADIGTLAEYAAHMHRLCADFDG